jgi:hypothetical protein
MSFLLHQTGVHDGWLSGIFEEVILHGLKDTLKILPFLFLTYLFMEWIEHKKGEKITGLLRASGKKNTVVGALLGAVPQCGFGATGASLFSAGILSSGTLIAIFLSTWFNRMTTATIVAITVYFVSYIVAALPFAEPIKPFMISEIMGNGSAFMFWMTHIPLIKLIENLAVLGCYICGFLTLAVINFNCKDIK